MITITPDEINFNELCNFSPRQKQAQEAVKKYKYIMYGGAMGGGKSYWLRWELIDLLTDFAEQGFKGVRVGLFCEDYPALKDRQISKIKYEFPAWLGTYNQADHEFTLSEEYGAGVICFRNLDDSSKYQSAEFAVIAIDELTKNIKENFIFLKTRLRWPGIKDVRFISGTNPGGIGHAWVKKLWLDKDFEPEEMVEAGQYYFIPARAEDNPHLDNDYYTQLDSLPPEMAKAYREGDWDIFKGQYFKEWRREIHTCEPFEISEEWTKFICLDYGFAKPSAVYWCAISPDEKIYLYRELYETGLIYSDLTKKIIANTPLNETIKYWVADPACWKTTGEQRLSGGEIIQQVYKQVVKKTLMLLEGNNARISGWSLMREYLKPITSLDNKVSAKLQVFNTCFEFIRTFPALVYDKTKVEDCDTDGEDHAADAVRYGIMTKPKPALSLKETQQKFFDKRMAEKTKKHGRGYNLRQTGY